MLTQTKLIHLFQQDRRKDSLRERRWGPQGTVWLGFSLRGGRGTAVTVGFTARESLFLLVMSFSLLQVTWNLHSVLLSSAAAGL